MENKEAVKNKNEQIRRAILVSQMQDHPGFVVFMEDFLSVKKGLQFQDIRGIKDTNFLNQQKGQLEAYGNIEYYLQSQKMWALKPMIDEETGEEEILNKKEE